MLFPYSTSNYNPHGGLNLNPFNLVSPQDFSNLSNKPMEKHIPNFNYSNSFTKTNYFEQQKNQLLDQLIIQNNQLRLLGAPSLENTNNYYPIQNLTPNQNTMFPSKQFQNPIFPLTSCQNIFNTLSQVVTPSLNINQQFISLPPAGLAEISKSQNESQKTIMSPMQINEDILKQTKQLLAKKLDLDSSTTYEKNEKIEFKEKNFRDRIQSQTQMCLFKNVKNPSNESVSVICTTGCIYQEIVSEEPNNKSRNSIRETSQDRNQCLGNQNTAKSDKLIDYSRIRFSQNSRRELNKEVISQQSFSQKQEQKAEIDEDTIAGCQSAGKSFFLISNYKKKLISNLEREDQQILIDMRRCKKFNFSKNVIKQFLKVVQTQINYLYNYQSDSSPHSSESSGLKNSILKNSNPLASDQNELRSNLKAYLSSNSYTHASIKRLMLHPLFSLYFSDFLEFHTDDWIKQGKTKYKQEQAIMIGFLKLCLKNPKLLIFLSEHDPTKPTKLSKVVGKS